MSHGMHLTLRQVSLHKDQRLIGGKKVSLIGPRLEVAQGRLATEYFADLRSESVVRDESKGLIFKPGEDQEKLEN